MYYIHRYRIHIGELTLVILKKDKKNTRTTGTVMEIFKGEETRKAFKIGDEMYFNPSYTVDKDRSLKKEYGWHYYKICRGKLCIN